MTLETSISTDSIGIFCNTQFEDLYEYSLSFYKDLPYDKIKVSGENNFYSLTFLLHVIEQYTHYDWGIFIDEDCFISNIDAMHSLLNHVIQNKYTFCGAPDGGVISHRYHNPISINTFFTIIDLKKIREKYNRKAIEHSKYGNDLNRHIPDKLFKRGYNIKYDNYEPYYKLFFWALRNGAKPLYLDVRNYNVSYDNLSSVLKNHKGEEFAYHSWFSRNWVQKRNNQKERILKLINDAKAMYMQDEN